MLKQHGRQIHHASVAVDVAIGVGLFAWLLSDPALQRADFPTELPVWVLLCLGGILGLGHSLVLGQLHVYESQRRLGVAERMGRLASASALTGLILSTLAFTLNAPVDRIFPLVLAGSIFAATGMLRLAAYGALGILRRAGSNSRNVLIVGAGPLARGVQDKVLAHPQWGLRIVAFLDEGESDFVPAVPGEKIHKFMDLPMLLRNEHIDEVLVACPRAMIGSLAPVVRECSLIGVPLTLLSDLFGDVLPPPKVGRFDSHSTLRFAPVHHNEVALAAKRGMDIAGALLGLTLTAPLVGLAALAIRLGSSGPVFFKQLRSGQNGRPFEMLKLRTMVQDAEERKLELMGLNEMDGPVFKIAVDPRVTPVGRILRKWSIDELPQFWNVLVGEMSLVGPRPPTPGEVVQYEGSERRRLSMRPGLTCIWQVSGRNEISFAGWMKLDLEYIDTWSLWRDIKILLATIPTVLSGRGAS
jgi:exopolysaccharide biosynthesis polyprenyl glycosylphosphotransferase